MGVRAKRKKTGQCETRLWHWEAIRFVEPPLSRRASKLLRKDQIEHKDCDLCAVDHVLKKATFVSYHDLERALV